MKTILKGAAAAALVGAMALASATSGEAREGRLAAAGAGFAAGTVVGAAAANAYGPRYAQGQAYDSYAHDGPASQAPRYYRGGDMSGCGTQGNYGQSVDRSACNQ